MFSVTEITVEYQNTPLGLDVVAPRFSWILASDKKNICQKSYSIKVYDSKNELYWDSGILCSQQSIFIVYCGKALLSRCKYTVALCVVNNLDERAEGETYFETGLMGQKLEGDFITHQLQNDDVVPLYLKEFNCDKKIKSARIYATALGVYEMFINGARVGNLYNAPFWTDYNYRLEYQTYDITKLLCSQNKFEALVANGWFKGKLGFFHRKNCYGNKTAFCANIFIEYTDGTFNKIITDKSWQWEESQIRSSELLDGENFDSQFALNTKKAVTILDFNKNKIIGQINEPVKFIEEIDAKELIITPKNEVVIDFKQNLTGIVKFSIYGECGQKVTISHAEILDKDGNFCKSSLREAKSEDSYILNGTQQTLMPHFTFHGFRYIKLAGFKRDINLADFKAIALHSDMSKAGEFRCNNTDINQLQSNIVWGQRDNFFDVPTDCPQRDERLGWTGDAQVFCRTSTFNYNTALFFTKWLGDLKAEQTIQNGVPQLVPDIISEGVDTSAACWGDAATIIPWTLYETYGDKRLLSEQFQSMKDWVEYITTKSQNNLWQQGHQYADWLALDKEEYSDRTGATDKYFIASAFYAYSTSLVIRAAEVLNLQDDYNKYTKLYNDIVTSFREEYITKTGRMVSETQTACVLALHFNLIQDEFKPRIIKILMDNIADHNNHLVTGFAGTSYLCHALTDNGQNAMAGTLLLNDDYPSWIYQIRKGATTIWERWNGIMQNGELFPSSMNSFNHYAYGSIGDWMYRKLAGINNSEPGYKKIKIKPHFIKDLTDVFAKYKTPYGYVSVNYKIDNAKIKLDVCIPVNTTAEIELSNCPKFSIGSGNYTFECENLLD